MNKVVKHIPTEIETVSFGKELVENLYELEDGTHLNLVFQMQTKEKYFARIMMQNLKIYEKHRKMLNTVIIRSSDFHNPVTELDIGSLVLEPEFVLLSKLDGDAILNDLMKKVEQERELTDDELSQLVVLPFLNSNIERSIMFEKAVEVLSGVADNEKKYIVRSLMMTAGRQLLLDTEFIQLERLIG